MAFPSINFGNDADALDPVASEAALTAAWAARRWNIRALVVPGLPAETRENPSLAQRRALAIAEVLRTTGVAVEPGPPSGSAIRLTPAPGDTER
jgi:outer membrane protein OmpA-like peptidoglycan-associated protein